MSLVNNIYIIPYLDYERREALVALAEDLAAKAYVGETGKQHIGENPRVREGYWNDLAGAGASAYNGSNNLTFATVANAYKFPTMVTISYTVPNNKVFAIYGIADYSPSPSLQAMTIKQSNVTYALIYLSPFIYTHKDASAYFNAIIPPQTPNETVEINLYGTKAATDSIDLLFALAEPGSL